MAIRIGSIASAALENMLSSSYQLLSAIPSMAFERPPSNPFKRPLATIAGMIGTKTSPRVFIALKKKFCFDAAACFTSSLVASETPASCMNSAYTLFTVPVPMMI